MPIAIAPREHRTQVFFAILNGSFAIGFSAPQFSLLATARGAAAAVYAVIDRQPPIDAYSEEGIHATTVDGRVQLKNIVFNYPSRPDVPVSMRARPHTNVQVLRNISLDVAAGESIALVGASGCGKSTIVNLLLRFYDVNEGQVPAHL